MACMPGEVRDYTNLLETFKYLFEKCLGKKVVGFSERLGDRRWEGYVKISCHTLRKTAWLWAVLAGGCNSDIIHASRHGTEKDAMKHREDAAAIRKHLVCTGEFGSHAVGD